MSDQKRATLTPFGKSDKKSAKKSPQNSFRLSFTLSDPNDNSCPVFDYETAVLSEEKKILRKKKLAEGKKTNGTFNSLNHEDGDDEDVKRLARKFEAKYGDKNGKSKSYAELGAGYDETDPFIDNTEAFDETLEENEETACGGYYVNSGPLQIKRVEVSDQSDADDINRRRHKRSLQVIEEDDGEEEDEVNEEDGEGAEKNGEEGEEEEEEEAAEVETKSISPIQSPPEIKKEKFTDTEEKPEENLAESVEEAIVKKKKKRLITDDEEMSSAVKPKKAKTVKTLLEEKRTPQPTPVPAATAPQPTVTAEEPRKQFASITSINEAIESVVNAANHNDNSNSSTTSHSGAATSHSDDSQDGQTSSQVSPPPLPPVSPDLAALVEEVKKTAQVTDNTRKTFNSHINDCLVKIEWKSIDFSATNRNLLFAHLAVFLPCTKDTLMRRAKKLFIHKEESQIDHICSKLKATIDATMPSVLENYTKECQRIADEKGVAVPANITTSSPSGEQAQQLEARGVRFPKRKYPWTEETRGYLRDIVKLKTRCFKVLKPRKSSREEYLKLFLNTKVKSLWPHGWMKHSVLLREYDSASSSGKSSHRHSSHSHNRSSSSRVNQPATAGAEVSHAPSRTPPPLPTTPLAAAKSPAEQVNLLSKFVPSPIKLEKPETFSVDQLLKRGGGDSVIVNGTVNHVDKILDLSPSVIQSTGTGGSDRTGMRGSDSVSLTKPMSVATSPQRPSSTAGSRNEPQRQREPERRMSEETTTATDILSQIISESLLAPPPPPPPAPAPPTVFNSNPKVMESGRDGSPAKSTQDQELFSDLMRDLKELNHLSGGGMTPPKQDPKNNSYSNSSWSHSTSKHSQNNTNHLPTQYHNEFLKHLISSTQPLQDISPPSSAPLPPYSRHSVSPYENFLNDMSKPVYSSSSHRSVQNMPPVSAANKMSPMNMNQGCNIIKSLSNTGISTGLPHNYMSQMEYGAEEQHLLGMPYGLPSWSYPGAESESQSHQ